MTNRDLNEGLVHLLLRSRLGEGKTISASPINRILNAFQKAHVTKLHAAETVHHTACHSNSRACRDAK